MWPPPAEACTVVSFLVCTDLCFEKPLGEEWGSDGPSGPIGTVAQEIPQGKKKELALLRTMEFLKRPLAASVPKQSCIQILSRHDVA
jgi:hypothetical protein